MSLYRVHKNNGFGDKFGGPCIGYLSLCKRYIDLKHVCAALKDFGLVPEHWNSKLLTLTNAPLINGLLAYSIVNRQTMQQVFYLHPLQSKDTTPSVSTTYTNVAGNATTNWIQMNYPVQYIQLANIPPITPGQQIIDEANAAYDQLVALHPEIYPPRRQ